MKNVQIIFHVFSPMITGWVFKLKSPLLSVFLRNNFIA